MSGIDSQKNVVELYNQYQEIKNCYTSFSNKISLLKEQIKRIQQHSNYQSNLSSAEKVFIELFNQAIDVFLSSLPNLPEIFENNEVNPI